MAPSTAALAAAATSPPTSAVAFTTLPAVEATVSAVCPA
jgi:hypothetical protein